jgi:hypothetical protein
MAQSLSELRYLKCSLPPCPERAIFEATGETKDKRKVALEGSVANFIL